MSPKTAIVIKGPRPTPLNLKQESHTIHKHHHDQKIRKQPIIIYVHSPEVIHTKPHDFMALVQKLTGHDSSVSKDQEQQQNKTLKQDGFDLNNNSEHESNKSMMFNTPLNRYIADIPLFTPNTSDWLLKLSDNVSSSPNMSNLLSPGSLVELMKEVHEY